MQIIAWLEDSLKGTMVSSLEVRNEVIDTISEISNTKIPKLKFQIGRQKSFQIQSNVRVINFGIVMRSSVLSIWLLMTHIFELSFYRTYLNALANSILTTKFQLERPSCLGNCSLHSMRLPWRRHDPVVYRASQNCPMCKLN